MKKIKIFAIVSLLAFISTDTFAADWYQEWRSDRQQRHHKRKQQKGHRYKSAKEKMNNHHAPPGNPVGAPIDGGLLVLLASSGIAIYGIKKDKKKSIEQ